MLGHRGYQTRKAEHVRFALGSARRLCQNLRGQLEAEKYECEQPRDSKHASKQFDELERPCFSFGANPPFKLAESEAVWQPHVLTEPIWLSEAQLIALERTHVEPRRFNDGWRAILARQARDLASL